MVYKVLYRQDSPNTFASNALAIKDLAGSFAPLFHFLTQNFES